MTRIRRAHPTRSTVGSRCKCAVGPRTGLGFGIPARMPHATKRKEASQVERVRPPLAAKRGRMARHLGRQRLTATGPASPSRMRAPRAPTAPSRGRRSRFYDVNLRLSCGWRCRGSQHALPRKSACTTAHDTRPGRLRTLNRRHSQEGHEAAGGSECRHTGRASSARANTPSRRRARGACGPSSICA